MPLVALAMLGPPAWILLMIFGFWLWWPLGLCDPRLDHRERKNGLLEPSRLGLLERSRKSLDSKMARMQRKMDRFRARMDGFRAATGAVRRRAATVLSTNTGPKR